MQRNLNQSKVPAFLLALPLLLLLTACGFNTAPVIANDPNNVVQQPEPPDPPYTDSDAATMLLKQGKVIDQCGVVLGKKIDDKPL